MNSDCSRFVTLVDRFRAGNPEVVNADKDCLKNPPEAIKSCSRVVDSLPTANPSALCSSAPTPAPPPKYDHPKTISLPAGTRPSYPPMHPKRDKVTNLAKSDKACCVCFRAHARTQGCMTWPMRYSTSATTRRGPNESSPHMRRRRNPGRSPRRTRANAPPTQTDTLSLLSPPKTPPPPATARTNY